MLQNNIGPNSSRKHINDLSKVFNHQIFPSLQFVHKDNQVKKQNLYNLTSPNATLQFERLTIQNFKKNEIELEFTTNENSFNNNMIFEEIGVTMDLLTQYSTDIDLIEKKIIKIEEKIDNYEKVFNGFSHQIYKQSKQRQIKKQMKMLCQ